MVTWLMNLNGLHHNYDACYSIRVHERVKG